LRPFKNYCYELFASNRNEIENILYRHYPNIKRNKFELRYFKEYPAAKNTEKILKEKKNIQALIRAGTHKSVDFGDLDDEEIDDEEIGETEHLHLNSTKKKKEKKTLISDHRDQFKEAFDILVKEVRAYQSKKAKKGLHEEPIPKAVINKFVRVLQANDIHHIIIHDALLFAVNSGLFIKEEKHDSDIDSSDDEDILFQDNQEFVEKLKKREQAIKINETIPVVPEWFTLNTNDNDNDHQYQNIPGFGEGEGVQTSFWSSFSSAKKQKKQKKKNKKHKKSKKLQNQIELSTNFKDIEEEDGFDGDIDSTLKLWANR